MYRFFGVIIRKDSNDHFQIVYIMLQSEWYGCSLLPSWPDWTLLCSSKWWLRLACRDTRQRNCSSTWVCFWCWQSCTWGYHDTGLNATLSRPVSPLEVLCIISRPITYAISIGAHTPCGVLSFFRDKAHHLASFSCVNAVFLPSPANAKRQIEIRADLQLSQFFLPVTSRFSGGYPQHPATRIAMVRVRHRGCQRNFLIPQFFYPAGAHSTSIKALR